MVWLWLLSVAQAAPFNPDRPGFSDSTGAVPPGALMTELGAQLSTGGGASVLGAPGLLIRGGLVEGLELRVSAPDLAIPFGDGDIGVGATGLGLKGAAEVGGIAASLVGTIPVAAASSLEAGLGDPALSANVGGGLSDSLGWGANAVVQPGAWAASASLGTSLGERAGAYLQGAALGGDDVQPLVGVGGTVMAAEALQLDLYADWLPRSGANIGAGIAKQW